MVKIHREPEAELACARRQAQQARECLDKQKALLACLNREGCDSVRARRVLGELALLAELLQDRVAHLEAAGCAQAVVKRGVMPQDSALPEAA